MSSRAASGREISGKFLGVYIPSIYSRGAAPGHRHGSVAGGERRRHHSTVKRVTSTAAQTPAQPWQTSRQTCQPSSGTTSSMIPSSRTGGRTLIFPWEMFSSVVKYQVLTKVFEIEPSWKAWVCECCLTSVPLPTGSFWVPQCPIFGFVDYDIHFLNTSFIFFFLISESLFVLLFSSSRYILSNLSS